MKYIDSYKATQTGLYLVIFSALIFMSLGILTSIYFVKEFDFHPFISVILFISISLIIYTPFWSYILVKWKIWSYKKIDDIEILIKLATRKNLIYPDNHFYTKYEICSKKDKNLIRELKRIKLAEDNTNILNNLYRDKEFKIKSYLDILLNNEPLLIINYKGVWLKDTGLIKWTNFSYLKLNFDKSMTEGFRETWIDYKIKGEKEIIRYDLNKLSFMNINYFKLEYLLEVYKKLATTTGIFYS
ncbi:hypothetical protein SAMN05444411_1512 [Lutibacter oricola]|uniref:Uncharacterized protein n=1 Tax=Lutibacter oricola TaxID=762486 RepID=A0A1H3HPA3_9FLAO|nr:hypothetical protein [Lutibacter oricola]SDY17313.1 hypothetical protein SAMN05444411_1512 [Lutibacter oricola]